MNEEHRPPLSEPPASIQTHLGIMQSVIQRMATNSTSSKTWCITLVSAILVVVSDKSKADYALLAFLPVTLFLALDAYYLAMEKAFRESYDDFIQKVHTNTLTSADLFYVKPKGTIMEHQIKALCSFSVWGFYLVLTLAIVFARQLMQ